MLWTCPVCQNENAESSDCCLFCGEQRAVKEPIQTRPESFEFNSNPKPEPDSILESHSSVAISSDPNRFSEAERTFDLHLKPAELNSLENGASRCRIFSFICYLIGGLAILGIIFYDGDLLSFILALLLFGVGFIFKLIFEVMTLFLHGNKSSFLTAKYSYVTSELINELLKKIDSLEGQVKQLSKTDPES